MSEMKTAGGRDQPSHLFDRVAALVEETRTSVAVHANAALTLMYWQIGHLIDADVLQHDRASYAQEIVGTLSPQLTQRFGRGFDRSNLHRMVKFARAFPEMEMVGTLSRQLSWSHFTAIIPVRSAEARTFYLNQAVEGRLSVRALKELIGRRGFERKEIANAQRLGGSAVPADSFRDPYFLDFLGLTDQYAERDLEEAIIRDMESFLLETGTGWAFVARQKRMTIDNDDFYLDLLFFSRPLRRLIAVELKIGRFHPSFKGQMDFYLKWLNRYERQKGEEAPVGLILCTEASREQVELLEMDKDGILVAEYWTELPPKTELQARIQEAYRDAQERMARKHLDTADYDG